jgi:hypothetical protein
MFVLSNETVRKMLDGELDYDEVPFDRENERTKGRKFEDQARVNLALSPRHVPICIATGNPCEKDDCELFDHKSGRLPDGWVCKEYKIDYPDVAFDSRYHVSHIGEDKLDIPATLVNLQALVEAGAKYICLGCHKVYQRKPEQEYEDGHGGRDLEMCGCGSDLFEDIDSFILRASKR